MPIHWGVDSFNRANIRMRSGRPMHGRYVQAYEAERTLYDVVCDQLQTPDYWGRYLNNHGSPQNALTADEYRYLMWRAPSCRLLLVYNDRNVLNSTITRTVNSEGEHHGMQAAREAARLAERFVPVAQRPQTRLYADLEQWYVSGSWLIGWMRQMREELFLGCGGLYGQPAIAYASLFSPSTTTSYAPRSGNRQPRWSSNLAYAHNHLSRTVGDAHTEQLSSGSLEQIPIWSSQPLIIRVRRGGRSHRPPTGLSPPRGRGPARVMGGSVEIWQYGRGLESGNKWLLDLNVASPKAFAEMVRLPARAQALVAPLSQ